MPGYDDYDYVEIPFDQAKHKHLPVHKDPKGKLYVQLLYDPAAHKDLHIYGTPSVPDGLNYVQVPEGALKSVGFKPDKGGAELGTGEYVKLPYNVAKGADAGAKPPLGGTPAKSVKIVDPATGKVTDAATTGEKDPYGLQLRNMTKKVQEEKDKEKEDAEARKKIGQQTSKWLMAIAKERRMQEEKEKKERDARAARLALLFNEHDSDSDDEKNRQDDLAKYMASVDKHLEVEKRLMGAW